MHALAAISFDMVLDSEQPGNVLRLSRIFPLGDCVQGCDRKGSIAAAMSAARNVLSFFHRYSWS